MVSLPSFSMYVMVIVVPNAESAFLKQLQDALLHKAAENILKNGRLPALGWWSLECFSSPVTSPPFLALPWCRQTGSI